MKGTERARAADPTTAGSETPAGSSRRRSLPALVKVLMQVTRMMCEARRAERIAESAGDKWQRDIASGKMDALFEVLEEVIEIEREEPEGNTKAEQP